MTDARPKSPRQISNLGLISHFTLSIARFDAASRAFWY